MVNALEKSMEKIDSENSKIYKENADKYIAQIKDVDSKIQNIVDNKVRKRLIFADKMPMQYFIDYYKLEVTAAFDGCSTEVDPSAKTIASETGSTAMQIQTLHNVSLDDFENGETWVSLMTRNIDVLKEALQ